MRWQRAQREREETSARRRSTAPDSKLSKDGLADLLLLAAADEARPSVLHCLTRAACRSAAAAPHVCMQLSGSTSGSASRCKCKCCTSGICSFSSFGLCSCQGLHGS